VIADLVERFLTPVALLVAVLALGIAAWKHIEAERARTQLNELRLAVAESTKRQAIANQQEGARRVFRQTEAIHAQVLKTEAAAASADRARRERDGLRSDLAAVVAAATGPHPAAAAQCPTAQPAVAVLAGLLDRVTEEREELARFADRAWLAGEACQRSYDALTSTTAQEAAP
jgi:hypothetical protein